MTWCNAVNLLRDLFLCWRCKVGDGLWTHSAVSAYEAVKPCPLLELDDAKLFWHIVVDIDNCFLQSGIDSLKQWSDHWLLKLNISKCKIVSFGRHVDKNYVYHINENNQITPLEYEQSYKDLLVCLCFQVAFLQLNLKWFTSFRKLPLLKNLCSPRSVSVVV